MSTAAVAPLAAEIPTGIVFAATRAGIKASGNLDLAYAEAPMGASVAALFTRNRVVAAPVEIGREHLKAMRGRIRGILVNSGNANCATGVGGLRGCRRTTAALAQLLGVRSQQILPSSTGIIGVPLPVDKIEAALPDLLAARASNPDHAMCFARAIMTTDTRPKLATASFRFRGNPVRLLGIAKGAGMIHPQLATMLVYVFTDIVARPSQLSPLLRAACEESFNTISIDGDTSTNDTVVLLASGNSDVELSHVRPKFAAALADVCSSLAGQIVSDGEGVQHRVWLHIEQARSRSEALQIARTIAHSPLVKTAWAGADPNWGRILAAVGRSGVAIDPRRIDIDFGSFAVCRRGCAVAFDDRAAHEYLCRPEHEVHIRLHRGCAALRFLTTDLTSEYVHINADYST